LSIFEDVDVRDRSEQSKKGERQNQGQRSINREQQKKRQSHQQMRGLRWMEKENRQENNGNSARDRENEISGFYLPRPLSQRADKRPAKQKKYWRRKGLKDDPVNAAKD